MLRDEVIRKWIRAFIDGCMSVCYEKPGDILLSLLEIWHRNFNKSEGEQREALQSMIMIK